MGVPKFFRYTSERYPCLNELVKQYQIPDFDNMYLDMNGIIHNCSHPDDSNPHFRITEEKIFEDVFHYISILFQIIKPKKLFFMAIDGVAPRAKMNQQRGRRFRSAREAEKLEEDAKAKGEVLPTEKRFDSNCITPGTVFMARLHEQLRYFVKQKISTDPLWSKVKVVLSGHETPGEGEHKIMDYIRWSRSQPDYEPNTRHCLYGLDADLIMLGMCTHEPHFALLREEVKFGKTTHRATSPEETNFYLLHLSLLREYLAQEFICLKDKLSFPFDIEKVVDDWVLMGFLVGNDFIPNLPNMHISNDALPLLYQTYMTVLPTLDGYINEAGDLNLERFEIFMQELAKIDTEKFQDTYADLKYFVGKTGRRPNAQERKEYKPNNDDTFNINIDDIKANKPDDELQALINATQDMYVDDIDNHMEDDSSETSDDEANFQKEFVLHKQDYYMNKLDYIKVTKEVLEDQAEGYVRAIQWNLYYYYKGCPSWCWFYPHHYAPYISDIKGFKDLKIEFELGEPFKPFEQLLAVLPAASKHLLPTPFHDLMTEEQSPIVHYYPLNFETDLNGKRNDWEAVVLIPFIDETNLLSAMMPCYQRLTEEELKRNSHGPMLVYNWTANSLGPALAPSYFPPIADCHATEKMVWREELYVPESQLKRGMLPNARSDMLYPGFPTTRHLKYTTSIKKGKVKVFDQPSRNENMIIDLIHEPEVNPSDGPIEQVAAQMLGKTIWVGWPHLTRAKVISVSNEKMRLHHVDRQHNNTNGPTYTTETNAGNLHRQWISERSTIIEHNMSRLGIELGGVNIIIHAVNLRGFKYVIQDNVQMVSEPEWCSVPCGYAYQAVVKDVKAYVIQEAGKYSTPAEAYPHGDKVFLLTQGQYYGCMATVVDSECIRSGRIKVCVREEEEPRVAAKVIPSAYRSAHHAAPSCGISARLLSQITGSVFVVTGERNTLPTENQNKINIGLNLKFNKKNQEVSGYTRRCKINNSWLYSQRCVDVVKAYACEYPELFDNIARNLDNEVFFESDLFPGEDSKGKVKEIATWLKSQPHSSAQRRECGSEALEPEEMKALAASIDPQIEELKTSEKTVTLHVKWSLLYKPELHEGNISPDQKADFKMYDRVVCVAKNITVPFGAKGIITAIYQPTNSNTVRLSDKLNAEPSFQVMFDEPFPGAMTEDLFSEARFYRMLPNNMLNISYGRKIRNTHVSTEYKEPFTFTAQPSVLRRDDMHSAFASYSPSRDVNKQSPDNRRVTPTYVAPVVPHQQPQAQAQVQDLGTNMLKNLLKISCNETDTAKKIKNLADQQSWRVKSEPNQPGPPPPAQRSPQQQQNWRKENAAAVNNRQQSHSNEWNNSTTKGPVSVPPFQQFPRPPQPPSQIPFPQFQNPHFQQRNHNQHYNQTHGNQNHGNQNHGNQSHVNQNYGNPNLNNQFNRAFNQGFPKHLPNISQNLTLGPSWNKDHNQFHQNDVNKGGKPMSNIQPNQPSARTEQKINNPFVPLQVQTSQRRTQNYAGPSRRKPVQEATEPTSTQPPPQPSHEQIQPQQNTSSRLQKKKKPRIAANLPFQLD